MDTFWTVEEFAVEGQPPMLTASLNTMDEVMMFVEDARRRGNLVQVTPPEPRNRLDRRQYRDEVERIKCLAGPVMRAPNGSTIDARPL